MKSPSKPAWQSLCQDNEGTIEIEDASDIEEEEDDCQRFEPDVDLPTNMTDVENIQNMSFDPSAQIEGPPDLFQHEDGATTTRIRKEYRNLFEHSPSSSFFAYIPVYFWVEVVHPTNNAFGGVDTQLVRYNYIVK
ncbi:hypothetical protein GQ600_13415 [Phytophthora cactorum]|nr:hypothetical protein GQ600_13415 [Phytophthora cactorum]